MLEEILTTFSASGWSLWGPFMLLLLCGVGLPVPEDIILIAAGFLGAQNNTPLLTSMAVMYLGILLGDFIIYLLGRHAGRFMLSSKFGRVLVSPEKILRAEALFHKHGTLLVFVGRFLPGLRAPTYFTTGLLKYSRTRFLVIDGIAAILSAPLFVWLGHWGWSKYAENMDQLMNSIGKTKMYVLFAVVILALGIFSWTWNRARVKSKT